MYARSILHWSALFGARTTILLATSLFFVAALLLRRELGGEFRRGARVVTGWGLLQRMRNLRRYSGRTISIGGVCVRYLDETKHFKLIGTTGTGKSTAIREMLAQALARGDRAVIADPDGGYLAKFLDRSRGDLVLNPFERQTVRWDPFGELRHPYDVDQLTRALVPVSEDASGNEWRGYARTLLTAIMRSCFHSGRHDLRELWRLMVVAPADELRSIVAGTPAQPFLDAENARMFGSIRSVMGSAVAGLEYVQSQTGPAMSIRRWVRHGGGGVLFLPYTAIQIAALQSLIATWMRLAIFESMSMTEGRDQRLWFVVDELDALGPIDGLKDALARLRKFGGRCVLGFQSIAQVSHAYGNGAAQTIVENCGNTLILRCSGSENGGTSRFASGLIGDREMQRRQVARGRDSEAFRWRGSRRSLNVSEQRLMEPALIPSELEQLPDLQGYLKLASSREWLRVSLRR